MTTNGANKEPVNLSLNGRLKRLFKAHCAIIGRDMSDVTEELYAEFLKRNGIRIADEEGCYSVNRKKK